MAILPTDIQIRLSGGAVNDNQNASLGGIISSIQVIDNTIRNLFADVNGAEAASGGTDYRCIYLRNAHPTLTLQNAGVFINENTPNVDTHIQIGLGTSSVSGVEQTVTNQQDPPTGVSFADASGVLNKIVIGNIGPGEWKAIWLKRVTSPNASALNSDSVVVGWTGNTAP